jgi:hypothetical protein
MHVDELRKAANLCNKAIYHLNIAISEDKGTSSILVKSVISSLNSLIEYKNLVEDTLIKHYEKKAGGY